MNRAVFAAFLGCFLASAACGTDASGVGTSVGPTGETREPGSPDPTSEDGTGTPSTGAPTPSATPAALTVSIVAPPQGTFVPGTEMTVVGVSQNANTADTFAVNGVPITPDADGYWEANVTLDPTAVANPVVVEVRRQSDGAVARDRVTVFTGESVSDGSFSRDAIALRVNDSALDRLETQMANIVGDGLDLGRLIPVGTEIIGERCYLNVSGVCLGSAEVEIDSPAPNFRDFNIDLDARAGHMHADITVSDMEINLAIKGSGLVPDCDLTLEADTVHFSGNFRITPQSGGDGLDVDLIGDVQVSFDGFDTDFGGICGASIIGDVIQSAVPDVEPLALDAISSFLQDPDGKGPLDDPISLAAQDALAGLAITGPLSRALGVQLDAPLLDVPLDVNGLTVLSNGRVVSTAVAANAPDFHASVHLDAPLPALSTQTPGGRNYDLGICVSPSFFNQLLKATVESGMLATDISEFNGLPLTAGALSLFAPAFAALDPAMPLHFAMVAEVAPFLTGTTGPNGELGELVLPNLMIEIRDQDETLYASVALDVRTGIDLGVAPNGQLTASITAPALDEIDLMVIDNAIGVDVGATEMVLPGLIEGALPGIAGALGSFPLPSFLGLRLSVVETSRDGAFYSIFANLR